MANACIATADCPRCGATKATFDVVCSNLRGERYGWQQCFEATMLCRHCHRYTVFFIEQESAFDQFEKRKDSVRLILATPHLHSGSLDGLYRVEGYLSLRDFSSEEPPEALPEEISAAFREATTCKAVQCWNASGAMFRLCVDLATKGMLPPPEDVSITKFQREKLAARLTWLFDRAALPPDLRELAGCIKDDGNDAAHDGTIGAAEAEDLLEFTRLMLERIYTEPARIKAARERTASRRAAVAAKAAEGKS